MPRGRFDKVFDKQFKIYIDYAHTPDALKNVFIGLQKLKKKKSIRTHRLWWQQRLREKKFNDKNCT